MRTFSIVLLCLLAPPAAQAQTVTVRATEYSTAPEGVPLRHFTARVDVHPASGTPYHLEQACDGACTFDNLPQGSTLVFSAWKTDSVHYKVNTNDLVILSKHNNGQQALSHPAQFIAADANCDGSLGGPDVVLWRKIILSIPVDTAVCRFWTLLDASAILPSNPLQTPLPATITVTNYDGRPADIHFLAIKNGDLEAAYPPTRAAAPPAGQLAAAPRPNPTRGPLWFGVQLPEPSSLLIELFDAAGRLVYTDRIPGQAGAQQVELPETALPAPGVYGWRITAGNGRWASGKVVRE